MKGGRFLMYIRHISIENIRGFGKADLDFQRPDGTFAGWTAVAGRNGSGKTTLLKAIAVSAVGKPAAWKLQSFVRWLRAGAHEGLVTLSLQTSERDRRGSGAERSPGVEGQQEAKLRWFPMSPRHDQEPGLESTPPGEDLARQFADRGDGWFIGGYGPFRRLSGSVVGSDPNLDGRRNAARLVTLFRDDVPLVESVAQLTHLHLKRLEEERRGTRTGAAVLLDNLKELFNDGLLPDGWTIRDVDSDGLWMHRSGLDLPLTELSDGYRSVAAMVLDLAMQLEFAYGELSVEHSGNGRPIVAHEGVVLIDEPEAHLHISWQQRIGFWLKEHFPRIQFIVATHSPYICQAADPRGLIRLPGPGEEGAAVEHVREALFRTVTNGDADEAATTELFGLDYTHSQKSEELRSRVARLNIKAMRGQATPEDRANLTRLSAELGDTPVERVDLALRKIAAAR
jgi:AAA domain, putative AbiEii toxin, Type IV TA system/AAA domain